MPPRARKKASPDEGSGLVSFSMHAVDDPDVVNQLRDEEPSLAGFGLDGAPAVTVSDPESVARRYLDQALASPAVPSLTAPSAEGAVSEFKSLGSETVPLTGTTTVKFRQMFHKIPLYGSLVTVELDENNNLVSMDSALGEPTGVKPVAKISPNDAVKAVADHPDYKTQLDGIVPRLHYYFDGRRSKWRLVYILEDVPVAPAGGRKKRSTKLEPPRFMDYVVDAHSGKVVAELPRTPSAQTVEQEAVDGLGVLRKIRVERSGRSTVLKDATYNVETYDFKFGDPTAVGARLPGKAVKNPPKWTPAAVSAHANAVAVAEFMRTALYRNNIDNRGGPIVSTINCVVLDDSERPNEWLNAFWSPDLEQMVYGQSVFGGELRSLAANIDVVAHEIFHGVTDSTSRLEYALQPGALNESYSDLFGVIISNLDQPDPRRWDWLLGEQLLEGRDAFRDLSDPERFGQPAHMDKFRVLPNTQSGDWGGVHINSGIHNKAGYNMLTATGADGKLVLTPTEVAGLLYLALTQRLSRTSQFTDSRRAIISSARTLFRRMSATRRNRKIAAIEKAFTAVGIR